MDKRRFRGLLSSLTLSLTAKCKDYHAIQMLYEKHHKLDSPTNQELLDLIVKLIQSFKEVYIVIDALDECDDYIHFLDVINAIHSRQLSHLHILVTSRREDDILESINGHITAEIHMSVKSTKADIISYVNAAVEHEHSFRKLSHAGQKCIREALLGGANGMFRWVTCQIEELRQCPNNTVLMDTLKSLPNDLEVIYDQILQRMLRSETPGAMALITWLIFGMHPLRSEELSIILTFDPTNGTFTSGSELPDPDDIIQICSSLVTKTNQNTVVLAHASVKEYFLDKDKKGVVKPSAGHDLIAHFCLRYILQHNWHDEIQYSVLWGLQHSDQIFSHFPLLKYSVNFWPDHYKLSSKDGYLQALVMKLFDSDIFSKWIYLCGKINGLKNFDVLPMAYAGFLGLEDIVEGLVMKKGWSNEYNIIMPFAARNGYINIVKLTLGMGADVNYCGQSHGTALSNASENGHLELVKFLINKGADVNHQCKHHESALRVVCYHGHMHIFKHLLNKGVDVNAKQSLHGLEAACKKGHTEIVKLLLNKRANVRAQQALCGLKSACSEGHTEIVKLLLNKGADIHAQQTLCGMENACSGGHTETVKLLLSKGVDIHSQQTLCGLENACSRGHTEIVKLLLNKGVDIHSQGVLCGLEKACSKGHTDIVKLLLDKGADVNAKEALNGLKSACSYGYTKVVKLLLDNGADANSEQALISLKSACSYGYIEIGMHFFRGGAQQAYTEIIKLLLDKGADVNAQQALDGLKSACLKGRIEIVKLLLDKGVDVNSEQSLDVLKAACKKGHTEIVKLFLDSGVNVNAEQALDGLKYACDHCPEIAKLFLDNGAELNAQQALDALKSACYSGCTDIVKVLMDQGADANAKETISGLNYACLFGYTEIVKLLLEKGANVNSPDFPFSETSLLAQLRGFTEIVELLEENRELEASNGCIIG